MANKNNNFENDDVSRLLDSLRRADAPGDFDFRVRARVAAGRPASRSTLLATTARVTAALLVILVVGYAGFRSFRSPAIDQAVVPAVPAEDGTRRAAHVMVDQHFVRERRCAAVLREVQRAEDERDEIENECDGRPHLDGAEVGDFH